VAADGLVVVASTTGGSTVARLGLDGTERWSLDVDPDVTARGDRSRAYVERADGTIAAHRLDDRRPRPGPAGRAGAPPGGRRQPAVLRPGGRCRRHPRRRGPPAGGRRRHRAAAVASAASPPAWARSARCRPS